jgi:U3 small nucleolar RNA-associated protein 21
VNPWTNQNICQERNKPKEAPKRPQKAPFFLPSTIAKGTDAALNGTTAATDDAEIDASKLVAERSRIAKLQRTKGAELQVSQFTSLLRTAGQTDNFDAFIDYFKSLSPAKADLEIRSLNSIARGYGNELVTFVRALTARLKAKRDFELVITWMAVFLRVHGDVLGPMEEDKEEDEDSEERMADQTRLQDALTDFKVEQGREGKRLGELVGYCRGIVGFLRSAR